MNKKLFWNLKEIFISVCISASQLFMLLLLHVAHWTVFAPRIGSISFFVI